MQAEPFVAASEYRSGTTARATTPLDEAQAAAAQETAALGEIIGELAIRLLPVLREEDENKLIAHDGTPRSSGESSLVTFVRDQQQRTQEMRRKVEGLLRRLDT